MALSAAERQRRCREKRKQDPEKVAEVKRKDLERYHTRKKPVKDMTPREHRQMKRKWQVRNKKRREQQNVLMNAPASTTVPSSPSLLPLSPSKNKVEYTYLGVAKSCVDEDGDVQVMFYKTVDDTGKIFKLVKSDLSDVMFENLIKIIPSPKEVKRGKRVYYEFDKPIEVFEK